MERKSSISVPCLFEQKSEQNLLFEKENNKQIELYTVL